MQTAFGHRFEFAILNGLVDIDFLHASPCTVFVAFWLNLFMC